MKNPHLRPGPTMILHFRGGPFDGLKTRWNRFAADGRELGVISLPDTDPPSAYRIYSAKGYGERLVAYYEPNYEPPAA